MNSIESTTTNCQLKYIKLTKTQCCPMYLYIRKVNSDWFNDFIFQKAILLLKTRLIASINQFLAQGTPKKGEILRGDDFVIAFYIDKAFDQPKYFMIDNGKQPKSEEEDISNITQTIFKGYKIESFSIQCLIQPKSSNGSLGDTYDKSISELMGIEFKTAESIENYFN